jgi:rhamnulokinase
VPASPGEIIRCCLDSLALEYRRVLDGLEDILGHTIDVLHLVGGGTQNELLNQLTADATRKTVIAGPIEATAMGNILVQALAIGAIGSLAEARAIVRASNELRTYRAVCDIQGVYVKYLALSV